MKYVVNNQIASITAKDKDGKEVDVIETILRQQDEICAMVVNTQVQNISVNENGDAIITGSHADAEAMRVKIHLLLDNDHA
jgi:hypothetical protein